MPTLETATSLAHRSLSRFINEEKTLEILNQSASSGKNGIDEGQLIFYSTLFGTGLGLLIGSIAGVDLQKQPNPRVVVLTTLGFTFLGFAGGVIYSLIN